MIAALMFGAGALLNAYGQYQEGNAQINAAEENAQIADQNAGLALEKAADTERRLRVQGQKALGNIRADVGASGITMQGSPLDVLKSSAANVELDALNIHHQGDVEATNYRNQAAMYRAKAGYEQQAMPLGIASSLLGAGAKGYEEFS